MTGVATRSCAFDRQVGHEYYFLSCRGDAYHCKADHRVESKDKSAWDVSRSDECHAFCNAVADPDSAIPGLDRWFISAVDAIGTKGEHLARFLGPGVPGATWHGFPVGGRRRRAGEAFPSEGLARKWRDAELIDRAIEAKINRRTI
jgi:hypothetical protein